MIKWLVQQSAANALSSIASKAAESALISALSSQDYVLRVYATEALGNMESKAAQRPLMKALNAQEADLRWSAAKALRKIATPDCISQLYKLAIEGDRPDILQTIAAIQERYGYYNHDLTQTVSETSSLPLSSSIKPMHILHLSHLHFGTPDDATLWSSQLAEDLCHDLNCPHLDALILSGDIANKSTPEEYEAAQLFLENFRQDFPLTPRQIILVPGNHDLNRPLVENAYSVKYRDECEPYELEEGWYIKVNESVVEVCDREKYKQRFSHFSNFYQTLKNQPYPAEYDKQYTLDYLPDRNLLILGLNSAWQLDHHYKSRASINPNAINNALTEIRRNRQQYQNCLKIAVLHHPLDSTSSDRITDRGFLEQLAVAGFRLFLHGHIHKAETGLFRHDMNDNGRKLDRICAGTFGAPTHELNSAYPWQYNLLRFDSDTLTVKTRRREEPNGAWKPDARWGMGPGQSSVDEYKIAL